MIVESDKSKQFCALTRDQYFESDKVHTSNDIEISPDKVKRFQNFANDSVDWLRLITNLGVN